MRVLLDESVPRRLRSLLPDHDVSTVQEMGWAGVDNGTLLDLASGSFEVLVTADRRLEHQQNLVGVEMGIVVLLAPTNRFEEYVPLGEDLARAVQAANPGALVKVGA